jgi:hypothetical protein
MLDEVLKNCNSVATFCNLNFDERAMRFATAAAYRCGWTFRRDRLPG